MYRQCYQLNHRIRRLCLWFVCDMRVCLCGRARAGVSIQRQHQQQQQKTILRDLSRNRSPFVQFLISSYLLSNLSSFMFCSFFIHYYYFVIAHEVHISCACMCISQKRRKNFTYALCHLVSSFDWKGSEHTHTIQWESKEWISTNNDTGACFVSPTTNSFFVPFSVISQRKTK